MRTPTGLTREEISEQTGISLATVCGRVCPMIYERKILALKIAPTTGKPELRLTKSGRYAQVVIIKPNPHWEVGA